MCDTMLGVLSTKLCTLAHHRGIVPMIAWISLNLIVRTLPHTLLTASTVQIIDVDRLETFCKPPSKWKGTCRKDIHWRKCWQFYTIEITTTSILHWHKVMISYVRENYFKVSITWHCIESNYIVLFGQIVCSHNDIIPYGEYPSCLHTTLASLLSQKSSQMVPQVPLIHTSTLPNLL